MESQSELGVDWTPVSMVNALEDVACTAAEARVVPPVQLQRIP